MTDTNATPTGDKVQPMEATQPTGATPAPATPPVASTPAGPKMIPESDLIAAKEDWKGKIDTADAKVKEMETSHKEALSTAQQELLQTSAKLEKLEAEKGANVSTAEAVTTAKAETETVKGQLTDTTTKLLEAKRQLIATQFNVPVDTLKDKDIVQLGNFEEALKVVAATRGIGNYALGGVGSGAAPQTNFERATAAMAATEAKGVRNLPEAPNEPPK